MNILFAILVFSFLILVHELGHFLVAKASGVQVNEFALFMGPAIFKKQIGETLYSLRCIPLGGYCAMEGEDQETENPRSFQKAAWWKRFCILVAGAAMNFICGILIMFFVFMPTTAAIMPVIDTFEDYCTINGENGLQEGDRILEVDGEKIYVYSDFSTILTYNGNPGNVHDLVVERNGEKVKLNGIHMEKHEVTDEDGVTRQLYGLSFVVKENMTFGDKMEYAWLNSVDTVRNVRLSLQWLITGKLGVKDLGGPVMIVDQMNQAAEKSESWFGAMLSTLYFGAFLSINLAIMNLLPIPALDGGRVVCLLLTVAVESVTRKKLDPKYEGYLHAAGMILLLALMAFIMVKDVFTIVTR